MVYAWGGPSTESTANWSGDNSAASPGAVTSNDVSPLMIHDDGKKKEPATAS
jgi:hypothetical protein